MASAHPPSAPPAAADRDAARFRAVVDRSADVCALADADGVLRFVSAGVEALLGYAPNELVGRHRAELVVGEDQARLNACFAAVVAAAGASRTLEVQARHKDAGARWLECTATNLLDDADVGAVLLHLRDVTERRRVRERVRERSFFLAEAQALAHVGSCVVDAATGTLLAWSPEYGRITGLPLDTTPAPLIDTLLHPDDRAVMRERAAAVVVGGALEADFRVVRPSGEVRWVHLHAVLEEGPVDGGPRFAGVLRDMTEQRAATEELRAREQLFRRIVEGTSEGVWVTDKDSVTTFINARLAAMLGRSQSEFVGRSALDFLRVDDLDAAASRRQRRELGQADCFEIALPHADGSDVWVQVTSTPLHDADGGFAGTLAVVNNQSERRRALETQARLAAIVEASPDAVISADVNGLITTWNPSAARLFGYEAAEVVGKSVEELYPDDRFDEERAAFARVLLGNTVGERETWRCKKDGSLVAVAVSITLMRDASGMVRGVSKILRDLTALRAAEDRLRHAQKMEAVGLLAGGIAHDFNNLLTVIHGYGSLVQREVDEALRPDVQEIIDAAARAVTLTQQLLAFSRRQVLQPRVLDPNRVIAGLTRMLRRLVGDQIELVVTPGEGLGHVRVDPGQLEQVLINLVVNARDAMPGGGRVTVATTTVADAGLSDVERADLDSRGVVVVVKDNGVGMDDATRARIFDPFFTTKEQGHGTGLGLSTVFGIVKQSGGHVIVHSQHGEGATFFVVLPVTDDALTSPPPTPAPTPSGGHETVLVVEDDDAVRGLVINVLRRHGYQVLDAQNGGEAFLLAERAPNIDLLLCDVVMPRMNGRQVAERLVPLHPKMRVLFMSGHFDDRLDGIGEGAALLRKPASPAELVARVREVLDAVQPSPLPAAPPVPHVLFVDDDDLLLESVKRVLRHERLRVSVARSGAEALALLERTAVDVVVTDQHMPYMSGDELIAQLAVKHPTVGCILMSANIIAPAVGGAVRLLQKPWEPQQLREALAAVTPARA